MRYQQDGLAETPGNLLVATTGLMEPRRKYQFLKMIMGMESIVLELLLEELIERLVLLLVVLGFIADP